MNADQIAEIRPALRVAIEGAPDICLTLEVSGACDKWLQVSAKTVNTAYPHLEDPKVRLKKLLANPLVREVSSWEPGKYVTIEFKRIELNEVAIWIDAYFVKVLGCVEGDYHLDIGFDTL